MINRNRLSQHRGEVFAALALFGVVSNEIRLYFFAQSANQSKKSFRKVTLTELINILIGVA